MEIHLDCSELQVGSWQGERVGCSAWPKEAQGRNKDSSGGRGAGEPFLLCPGSSWLFHKGPSGET